MSKPTKIHQEIIDRSQHVNFEIGELVKLVYAGNKEAAIYLHSILQTQIRSFLYLSKQMPHLFEPIAAKSSTWPSFITTDENEARSNAELVAKLNLGGSLKAAGKKHTIWKTNRKLELISSKVDVTEG